MILAAVVGLEALGGETRLAVAVPDSIGEEAFQRYFLERGSALPPSTSAAAAAFEHGSG